MTKQEQVQKLWETANEQGLVCAIHQWIGHGVKVEIGFSSETCCMSVEEINFSVRSMNALKRAGLFTIGDVIGAISNEELLKVRNLGRKSLAEIQEKVLAFGYDRLSAGGKQAFLLDLLQRNGKA